MDVHQFGHPAPASTSAKVRKRYWIIGVTRVARSVVFKCIFRRQIRAKAEQQHMAPLPPTRLIPAPPFTNCAVDLFGPYKVRIRPRVLMPVWGVIITCLGTRTVYCDVVLDYSAMEFTQTLRRFLSLRGTPRTMMSDQGSQLVRASKDIRVWCAAHEIEWTLVTPHAAHQNGCAEALVKSVKSAYKSAVGDTVLSAFEMQTVLFEAANLVNDRPRRESLSFRRRFVYLTKWYSTSPSFRFYPAWPVCRDQKPSRPCRVCTESHRRLVAEMVPRRVSSTDNPKKMACPKSRCPGR